MPTTAPKTKAPRDYRELLRAGQWFRHLPDDFQDALLSAGQLRTVAAQETLFYRGDASDGIYAVLDGSIRVSGGDEDGAEALFTLVEHPFWFGELAVFDGLPRTHDAAADRRSLLLHVPQAPLQLLLDAVPLRWRQLGLLLTSKLRLSFMAMEETVLLPLAIRLARRLLLMAEGYGGLANRSNRVIHVRQEQLAAMLGTSRQTANQLLKEMESTGLLRAVYGGVEVVDLARLRRLALSRKTPPRREG